MEKVIIYQKPTCSTCRQVIKLADASGKPYEAINYYEKPFSKTRLKELLKKGGIKAADILRTKEDVYRTHKSKIANMNNDEIIDLMIQHPDLIQRPLVEKGKTVILARPPETVNTLL
ncbi:ArsC/Spx/MgsR family protein [Candidatus Nitrospira salsa]|nr:MAG: arsenate reductase [Nitrospirales bacterium]